MNRFFSKFPWLRPLGCGLLVTGALLRQTPPLAGELSVYSIVCFVLAAGAALWPFRKKKKK